MKEFNITGTCIPHLHYIVDTGEKIGKTIELIQKGKYFTINRPRQFGKTTTLYLLEKKLTEEYFLISTSFEGVGDKKFEDEKTFSSSIFRTLADGFISQDDNIKKEFRTMGEGLVTLEDVSEAITNFVKNQQKKVVVIIDEIDRASNHHLFLNFLGMLRKKYLKRDTGKDYTFHSVILAGVHDIKNIKLKMRPESEKQFNSPWNIAADFEVDMSFSMPEIATMLKDYEKAYHTGMQIAEISAEIYKFTSGYPYLVSKICKIIDEKLEKKWNRETIQEAVARILEEKNTLFDDMIKNIENNQELANLLTAILVEKQELVFNIDNPIIEKGIMFGYLTKDSQNHSCIANKIFEVRLLNYLVSKLETARLAPEVYNYQANFILKTGELNMPKVLSKFQEFIKDTYSNHNQKFYESQGRLLLIAFVKPIINGTGFYYIEAQQSYERRSDMIITFNQKEYILEFKIWRGEKYHQEGLEQLSGYLDSRSQTTGYLVVFNFNQTKEFSNTCHDLNGKTIYEVMV